MKWPLGRLLAVVTWGSYLLATLLLCYWQRTRRRSNLFSLVGTRQPRPTPYSLSSRHRVEVVDSWSQWETVLAAKSPASLAVLALDCEWVEREGGEGLAVALLQLGCLDGHCVLVRLCKTGAPLSPSLTALLQDNRRLKIGVGIDGDASRLERGFAVKMTGRVDLRHIAAACGLGGRWGLASLAASVLGVQLDKSWRLRCSDWEAPLLSQQQVEYAGSDVAVTLDILRELVNIRMRDHSSIVEAPVRYTGRYGESLLAPEAHSVLLSLCGPVVDVCYKQPKACHFSSSQSQQKGQGTQPRLKKRLGSHCVRQTPLYDNCRLLAPDHTLLSTVDHKKIQWYLQRQLGTLVCEDPPTLRLNFEPAGKPGRDREYYREEKMNICVVCGSDKDCIRKNIVPHEYRRHFPAELKDHMSHDVLLLCVSCHQLASLHSDQLKARLAEEYGAPLASGANARYRQDHHLTRVRNSARALLKEGEGIPEERRRELVAEVAEFLHCTPPDLTTSKIGQVAEIDTRQLNSEFSPHAELVVRAVMKRGEGVLEFQKRWRQHFVDTMQPRFLPELWNVNHNPRQL